VVASSADSSAVKVVKLADGSEFGALDQVTSPWYVARAADGSKMSFTWGPGLRTAPRKGATAALSPARGALRAMSGDEIVCSLLVSTTGYESGQLTAYTNHMCSRPPGVMRTQSTFQRKNLLTFWVRYSSDRVSTTTYGNPQILSWAMPCDPGRSYYYRLRAQSYNDSAGISAWYAGPQSPGKYFCGT